MAEEEKEEEEEKELRRPPLPLLCCSCWRAEGKVTRKLPSSSALPLPYLYSGERGGFARNASNGKGGRRGEGEEGHKR